MDFGLFGSAATGMPGSIGLPDGGFVAGFVGVDGSVARFVSADFATGASAFFEPGPAMKYQAPPASAARTNSTSAPASKRDFFPWPHWGHAAASASEACGTTGDANVDPSGGAELPVPTSGGGNGTSAASVSADSDSRVSCPQWGQWIFKPTPCAGNSIGLPQLSQLHLRKCWSLMLEASPKYGAGRGRKSESHECGRVQAGVTKLAKVGRASRLPS